MKIKKSAIIMLFIALIGIICACKTTINELDDDSRLANVQINGKDLENFNSNVLEYDVILDYIGDVTITATPSSSKAKVTGVGNIAFTKDFSQNIIVEAEDKSTTTYILNFKVNIDEEVSLPYLTAIYIDNVKLSDFSSDKLNYSYELSSAKSVNITADYASNLTVSGLGSFNASNNEANIVVSNNKGDSLTYKIKFIVKEEIKPSIVEIFINDKPIADFSPNKYDYEVEVTDLDINIKATPNDLDFEVIGTGNYILNKGENKKIELVVKNETLETTYTILFITPSLDSNSTLSSLSVNGEDISLVEGKTDYIYTIYDNRQVVIAAKATSSLAKVSGTGSFLVDGDSKLFKIVVTAEDKSQTNYNLEIKYAETDLEVDYIAGLYESIALTLSGTDTNIDVYYNVSGSSIKKAVDKELIRVVDGKVRVDILGLKPGKYDVQIGNMVKKDIEVYAYDRSGYAFFGNDSGVGAYKDDGTLKENALVIYVNDETKNTVEAKINGKTYVGLVNIMTNLRKSEVPVVIRVLGKINAAMWNQISYDSSGNLSADDVLGINNKPLKDLLDGSDKIDSSIILEEGYNSMSKDIENGITVLEGLTNRINYDSKNNEFDSYYNMIDIQEAKNVTIEGVGTDAEIYQFGFTWKKCYSIEVRNLTFTNTPEDACSFEGSDDVENYAYYHVHHNTFNRGYNTWDVCGEQDKHEGDGAVDLKKLHNVTIAYNMFNNNHKTSLVGGSDSHIQYNITYHHNFYNQVESRLPLGRQANLHIYNNYFYKVSNTSVDLRAGAYAFLEGNYFEASYLPTVRLKETDYNLSSVKAYNNYADDACKQKDDGVGPWQVVSNREDKVDSNCVINGVDYSGFDTNSNLFYYVNGNSDVMVLTSPEEAKEDVLNYAGVLKIGMFS